MITFKNYFRLYPATEIELKVFPDTVINLYSTSRLPSDFIFRFLRIWQSVNHWLVIARRGVSLENADLEGSDSKARDDMNLLFSLYSVVPARDRRSLRRFIYGSRVYRDSPKDSLRSLEWVSARYVHDGRGQLLFLQSPILLFDSSFSEFLMDSWCHAFVSLVRDGFLECVVHHACFCLGAFQFNPFDLPVGGIGQGGSK